MKKFPLWFWISIVVVLVAEALFLILGPYVFDRPVMFLQSSFVLTFVIHPLYMVVVSIFLWRQKHDLLLIVKACLLMLIPIWIAWFLFIAFNETG